ncbi:sugar phosphate isomerase/epimerase [Alicyclobacillus sacchari]|uniref:Sugar phosphate isomerase/epimerase n=1 Tax=Alicyclobacillus sacchari TaxID=392010 RepID=A0A4R8LU08_9BACL|nr:sugar phosphate isomerase/epimerase [Alicyclobacillus sacchari]TDY51104.1 sugar phosphate isomerase/epimerase [Alicyclobacillus sacchari]
MAEIGLQMYTLRDLLAADFAGTLKKVREIGYRVVELHTYGGYTAAQLRDLLDELGIRAVSCHVPLVRLESELDKVIEEAKQLGLDYVVCPWLPPERRQTKADYDALFAILHNAASTLQEAGLRLAYHNHDFEFQKFDGKTALDSLLSGLAADGVQMELDVYWAHKAGYNPVDYLNRYAGRADLLHMKDADGETGAFAEVGSGVLDWSAIIAAAEAAGVRYYIVEQDVCPGDPLAAIQSSLAFLQSRAKA